MKPGLGGRRCSQCGAKIEGAGSKLLRDCPSCGAPLDGPRFTPAGGNPPFSPHYLAPVHPPKAQGSLVLWIVVALLCVVIGIGIAVFFQVRALQDAAAGAAAPATTADAGSEPTTSSRSSPLSGGKPFDRASATQQLTDASETVDDCREPGGAAGTTVIATIVIQPNGKVSEVTFARAGLSDTSQGKCIGERFSKIRVPPFAGPPERLSKGVTL